MKTNKNFAALNYLSNKRQKEELRKQKLLASKQEVIEEEVYSSSYRSEEDQERLHNAMRHVM